MIPTNPNRYWFSLWDNPVFANGWVFGSTPEEALEEAWKQIKRWARPSRGPGVITLQRDTRPAEYFDYRVEL